MTYEQREKVEELSKYLLTHIKSRPETSADSNALEADFMWDAARFWANVLFKTTATTRNKTLEEFWI